MERDEMRYVMLCAIEMILLCCVTNACVVSDNVP